MSISLHSFITPFSFLDLLSFTWSGGFIKHALHCSEISFDILPSFYALITFLRKWAWLRKMYIKNNIPIRNYGIGWGLRHSHEWQYVHTWYICIDLLLWYWYYCRKKPLILLSNLCKLKRTCTQLVYPCHRWYMFHIMTIMGDWIHSHGLHTSVTLIPPLKLLLQVA